MKTPKTVFIAIEIFDQANVGLKAQLENAGFTVRLNSSGHSPDISKDPTLYDGVDYIIAGLEKYDEAFFNKYPRVRAISRVGVGVDSIDTKAALARGVKIFKTSDKPSVAVAELCVSNMIALLRGTFKMTQALKSGGWNPIQGKELRSCTVGVVGVGSIGKEVIKRLHGFGCNLLGTGRTWDADFASTYSVEHVSLEELMKLSDVLTVHLPYTKETEKVISRPLIMAMPRGAVLINTSRSGVIDNDAVAECLRNGHLAGAAIDVFNEHRSISPYEAIDNVILTPHIGSHTIETRKSMEAMAVESLILQDKLEHSSTDDEARAIFNYLSKHTVK